MAIQASPIYIYYLYSTVISVICLWGGKVIDSPWHEYSRLQGSGQDWNTE